MEGRQQDRGVVRGRRLKSYPQVMIGFPLNLQLVVFQ